MIEAYPKEIRIYATTDGRMPYTEWSRGLDPEARARIQIRLDNVRRGNLGHRKSVGKGVTELKVDYGPGYRIYIGQQGKRVIVLLGGGDKRRQQRDIEQAQDYWADYKKRKDDA